VNTGSESVATLALLTGGRGYRLASVVKDTPKALVDVGGEPFIRQQLRLFKREQLAKIVLCTGYQDEAIQRFVGSGSKFGIKVEYSFDGDQPLGTGGAIRNALPILSDPFWVMYGDTYLDIELRPIWDHFNAQDKKALMIVFHNKNQWDRSNVVFDNGKIRQYDKKTQTAEMQYIDYGLGLFRQSVFDGWRDVRSFDLANVYSGLLREGELLGYEADKRFYEIGTPESLRETRAWFDQNKMKG